MPNAEVSEDEAPDIEDLVEEDDSVSEFDSHSESDYSTSESEDSGIEE